MPEQVKQPIRAYEIEPDVDVPFRRAKITGIFSGLLAAVITGGITFVTKITWDVALGITVTVGLFVGLVAAMGWWLYDTERSNSMIWKLERFARFDLDGGGIGKSPPKVRTILVNAYQGRSAQKKVLQDNRERVFTNFVRGCFENNTTSSAFWVRSGKISQADYEEIRDSLIQSGYAHRKHSGKTAGWEWNPGLTADEIIEMALRQDVNNESSSESPSEETDG